MKIVAFIMAFVVMALSIMPCADSDNAENDSKAATVIAESAQHNDAAQQDECSPFCHCTCCGTFSPNHFTVSLSHITLFQAVSKNGYLPADVIEIALPIWQPPQLI